MWIKTLKPALSLLFLFLLSLSPLAGQDMPLENPLPEGSTPGGAAPRSGEDSNSLWTDLDNLLTQLEQESLTLSEESRTQLSELQKSSQAARELSASLERSERWRASLEQSVRDLKAQVEADRKAAAKRESKLVFQRTILIGTTVTFGAGCAILLMLR